MIGDITAAHSIYIVCGYTDMRKSIDGLCAIVKDELRMDPNTRSLFLFCGRRCDRIKLLLWEPDGFVLLYKRLSVKGRYRWPRNREETRSQRIRYYESTYRCRDCCDGLNGADHGILVRSTIPAPLLSNSPASASSVAWTMYQKYGNAMPLYRQEKDWKTLYEY